MNSIRWAAVLTIVMAVLNIPAGFTSDSSDMPTAVAWIGTVVGVIGLVTAVAVFRHAAWARSGIIAVGLLNIAGGVAAMAAGWAGGPVGLVLGAGAVGLAFVPARQPVISQA
jgi:hypothetical protein